MNNHNRTAERRRSPRIQKQIALKIRLDDYDLVGQTRDISSIGASCTINKYIQPFSLISIVFLLPIKTNGKNNVYSIRCQGAVVRIEKASENNHEYNMAIYFNRLKYSDKMKLLEYVRQHQ